jgi:hypothetical protein
MNDPVRLALAGSFYLRGNHMPEASTSEGRSSVEVSLTAKGEAQIKVKAYEGEEADDPKAEDGGPALPPLKMPGAALMTTAVNRLMHTIEELEENGIKVVGRDAPVAKPQESTGDAPSSGMHEG